MFLFFTKKDRSHSIEAVYTGRFAFLNNIYIKDKKATYNQLENTFHNIQKKHKNSNELLKSIKLEEIKEEFLHSKVFHKNISSLIINGLRYITRILWRITENPYWVKKYYKYRTYFFIVMYSPQEILVDKIKKGHIKSDKIKFGILFNEDKKLFELISKFDDKKFLFLVILLSPFLIFTGYVITKFFAIIIYEKNIKTCQYEHQYISNNKIVKNLNRNNTSIFTKIGRLIQIESLIKKINNFDENNQNILWFILRFRVEKSIYKEITENKINLSNQNICLKDEKIDFDEYFERIIIFAFNWADIKIDKNRLFCSDFIDIAYDAVICDSNIDNFKYFIKSNNELKRVIEFFYLHGN